MEFLLPSTRSTSPRSLSKRIRTAIAPTGQSTSSRAGSLLRYRPLPRCR